MRQVTISVPVSLPDWLYRAMKRLKLMVVRALPHGRQVRFNLLGDREIEWSWVTAQMPSGPGDALDFGPSESSLGLIAALRDFNVVAVDLSPVSRHYVHPNIYFRQGDILKLTLPEEHFDLVINCSTVEHVGLTGRYGVLEDNQEGDLEAMGRLRKLMKPNAIMLLTIPLGQDAVFWPMCRVYGQRRLPQLLAGYTIERQVFWIKNQDNQWIECDRELALNFKASAGSSNPLENCYALGCFRLRKPGQGGAPDASI